MSKSRDISLGLAALALIRAAPVLAQPVGGGADLFEDRCSFCHVDDGNGQGPSLKGVVGRKAGSSPGFAYSTALKGSGLTWSATTLDQFLTNPGALVPGTAMLIRVPDAKERDALIRYLASRP